MPFPINLTFSIPYLFNNQQIQLSLNAGLTVLVGPNGSGKTQVLKALKNHLKVHSQQRKVRYLSSGRFAQLEFYRSNTDGQTSYTDPSHANFGASTITNHRHLSETAIGDFQTLSARPDIQIKVKERLSKLFGREIYLEWHQGNLRVNFTTTSGSTYSSAQEASGLLNLISLLAALYDDEVGVLLIDEPEISLHPQLQSFYYREILKIAGDPINRKNKIVVLSTHSTEFIAIRKPDDMINLIFFNTYYQSPVQIQANASELQNRKLRSLLTRLGLNQKLAFFSHSPLLVEGPSDQTVCTALENKLNIYLGAAGSQIVPVTGKGQMPIVNKFFKLIGKKPVILTDIDSLADNLELINSIQFDEQTLHKVTESGFSSVYSMASGIYNDYCQLIQTNWADIAADAEKTKIWLGGNIPGNEIMYKKRSGLSVVLNAPDVYFERLNSGATWKSIATRLKALLEILEYGGCFILRKGYVEDYYLFAIADLNKDKAETAVEEMIGIEDTTDIARIKSQYSDLIRALKFSAKVPEIDEAAALIDLLLAIASPSIYRLKPHTTNEELKALARQILGERSTIFEFAISQQGESVLLSIDNTSDILDVEGFPLQFTPTSNPLEDARRHIKRKD